MKISDLDTPALVVDLEIMERNLRKAADYARYHGLRLRPHTKTHKIPALAEMQLAAGAAGLTVAKVGEAEVMLRANPEDLLLAYPVLGSQKLERLVKVAHRARVTVSVDSVVTASQLSAAASAANVEFGILAEMDVGMGRVGVDPGQQLLELARGIIDLPGLSFEGIAFFPGHLHPADHDAEIDQLGGTVTDAVATLRRAGLPVDIVSGGSTPLLFESHRIGSMNEIRPGTYIFNDLNTTTWGGCGFEDCAATVLTTIVSTARAGQVVVDAGSKTLSHDPAADGLGTFGCVRDTPAAVVRRLNEEHGYIDIRSAGSKFRVGDRLTLIPNHVCPAVNLHDVIYGILGDKVEEVWTVEARGKAQ